MKYTELKKEIKKASKEQKEDGIQCYISTWGESGTVSNFLKNMPNFNQLYKAEKEGLLIRDWDTLNVA